MRDYQIVSPSLEGVLNHDSLLYEGIERPIEVMRIMDGPASKGRLTKARIEERTRSIEEEKKVLETYFQDLHGVFMKKFSHFVVETDFPSEDLIQLQAMLQEMIKVKGLIVGRFA